MIANFLNGTLDKLRHTRSGVSNFVDIVLFILLLKFLSDKDELIIGPHLDNVNSLVEDVSKMSNIDYRASDINYEDLKSIIFSGLNDLERNKILWSPSDLDDIFEDLHNFLISKLGLEADIVTPKSVVRLLTNIVKDSPPKSIYDPFARSGNLLQAFNKRFPKALKEGLIYGRQNYLIARTEAFMTKTSSLHFNFAIVDQKSSKYDIVVTNPPFGQSGIRNTYSTSGDWTDRFLTNQLELTYLVQALGKLSNNGFASIVLPSNVLSGQSLYYEMRKELIERNLLESVIILPGKLFYSTAIAPVIFNIDKGKKDKKVLLLDASTMGNGASLNELSKSEIERIVDALQSFRAGTLDAESNAIFKIVSPDELRNKDYDLRINSFKKLYEIPSFKNAQVINEECEELERALLKAEVKFKALHGF